MGVEHLEQRQRGSPALGTASDRLRAKIWLVSPPYAVACRRLIDHPRVAEALPEFLFQFHCIIRTTVPLMEAAIERSDMMSLTDPVADGVGDYLKQHVEEERDHDEWLLGDLEVLGWDRQTALRRVPTPTVAALAGAQYYWVLHYHPVALLGYFAFMEGSPPTPALIDELVAKTGHPRVAFRTLEKHGELDPGHSEEIDRVIDSLPLTPEHETVLGLSAMSTANLLWRMAEEVLDAFPVAS